MPQQENNLGIYRIQFSNARNVYVEFGARLKFFRDFSQDLLVYTDCREMQRFAREFHLHFLELFNNILIWAGKTVTNCHVRRTPKRIQSTEAPSALLRMFTPKIIVLLMINLFNLHVLFH